MGKVQVGINGFGRIGRVTFRAIMENYRDILEVKAINDLGPVASNAHLLRFDSNYGRFPLSVETGDGKLVVGGDEIAVLAERDPGKLPWADHGVDIVLECTGFFTDATKARAHIDGGGAQKVIISAPAKGEDQTIVLGVNDADLDPKTQSIISNASCTTNCLAPLAKAILGIWGIEWGFMNTIHSYTNDQRMNDQLHEDLRRARAGAVNMIPTSTGAAKAISLVLPELKGKMHGFSMRVPTPTVSCVDLTVQTIKPLGTADDVNAALRAAANEPYLGYTDAPAVSTDFRQDSRSSIMDLGMTTVLGDRALKVLSWYDNEWGYSCRLAELCSKVAKGLPAK
ncbi:MAG: type I glyceraldehyde-3-phosphate dehydrogenase [Fimbriimonadaceae bacterium]|nr:type I glyceraldehyde-3-phosphate dehydrogenase [Fimbriimonadaceae bacterium]